MPGTFLGATSRISGNWAATWEPHLRLPCPCRRLVCIYSQSSKDHPNNLTPARAHHSPAGDSRKHSTTRVGPAKGAQGEEMCRVEITRAPSVEATTTPIMIYSLNLIRHFTLSSFLWGS